MSKALKRKIQKAIKDLGLHVEDQDGMISVFVDPEDEPFMFITLEDKVTEGCIGITVELSFPDSNLVMVITAALSNIAPIEPFEPVYWPEGANEALYGDAAYSRWTADSIARQNFIEAELGEDEKTH